MDKSKDNLIPEFMINDLFLKLKQFLFLDGNYKQRHFIINNMTKNMQDTYKHYQNEISSLELYNLYSEDIDFLPFISKGHFKNEIMIFQIYIALSYNLFIADKETDEDTGEQKLYFDELFKNLLNQYGYEKTYFDKFLNLQANEESSETIKFLASDGKRIKNFIEFTLLSIKYGLFINDLFSVPPDLSIEEIRDWINIEDVNDTDIFFPFPRFNLTNKMFDLNRFENHPIPKNRFSEAINKIYNDKKLERLFFSSIRSALRGSRVFSQIHSSFVTRKLGLFLWDQCKHPHKTNKCKFTEICEKLYHQKVYASSSQEDFNRIMRMYLNFTDKCIKDGKFLPYKHKDKIIKKN